jgi:CHAD domain-containing protein
MARTASVNWDERFPVAVNAGRRLPRLAAAYFRQVREFLDTDFTPTDLHRLRLASKRLRYTLELFRPLYPAALEERLDALKKLQDFLGDVNDAVASGRLLRKELKHHPKARKFLKDRAAEKSAEFVRHWKDVFDAPGQEAWWTEFLAGSARTPRQTKA